MGLVRYTKILHRQGGRSVVGVACMTCKKTGHSFLDALPLPPTTPANSITNLIGFWSPLVPLQKQLGSSDLTADDFCALPQGLGTRRAWPWGPGRHLRDQHQAPVQEGSCWPWGAGRQPCAPRLHRQRPTYPRVLLVPQWGAGSQRWQPQGKECLVVLGDGRSAEVRAVEIVYEGVSLVIL